MPPAASPRATRSAPGWLDRLCPLVPSALAAPPSGRSGSCSSASSPWPWPRPTRTPTRSSPRRPTARRTGRRPGLAVRPHRPGRPAGQPSGLAGRHTVVLTFLDPVCTSRLPAHRPGAPVTDQMLGAGPPGGLVAVVANPIYAASTAFTSAFDRQEGLDQLRQLAYLTGSLDQLHKRLGRLRRSRSRSAPARGDDRPQRHRLRHRRAPATPARSSNRSRRRHRRRDVLVLGLASASSQRVAPHVSRRSAGRRHRSRRAGRSPGRSAGGRAGVVGLLLDAVRGDPAGCRRPGRDGPRRPRRVTQRCRLPLASSRGSGSTAAWATVAMGAPRRPAQHLLAAVRPSRPAGWHW